MKRLIDWIEWSFYRIQVAKNMHVQLSGAWSWFECWLYAKHFKCQYESMLTLGDKPDPRDDVEEELHCWTE